jgi:hypothetical protein
MDEVRVTVAQGGHPDLPRSGASADCMLVTERRCSREDWWPMFSGTPFLGGTRILYISAYLTL